MPNNDLIPANELCVLYNVEVSFIRTLGQSGILEITSIGENVFVLPDQLAKFEKYVRLHQELEINPEGLEAITHLLERVSTMQEEISFLRNRLRIYE